MELGASLMPNTMGASLMPNAGTLSLRLSVTCMHMYVEMTLILYNQLCRYLLAGHHGKSYGQAREGRNTMLISDYIAYI